MLLFSIALLHTHTHAHSHTLTHTHTFHTFSLFSRLNSSQIWLYVRLQECIPLLPSGIQPFFHRQLIHFGFIVSIDRWTWRQMTDNFTDTWRHSAVQFEANHSNKNRTWEKNHNYVHICVSFKSVLLQVLSIIMKI